MGEEETGGEETSTERQTDETWKVVLKVLVDIKSVEQTSWPGLVSVPGASLLSLLVSGPVLALQQALLVKVNLDKQPEPPVIFMLILLAKLSAGTMIESFLAPPPFSS